MIVKMLSGLNIQKTKLYRLSTAYVQMTNDTYDA